MNDEILVNGPAGISADYLNTALECAHDGIVIADSNAILVYANRSYELISGFNRSDMIGRSMHELMDQGYISVSGTLKVLETGEPFSTTQVFQTQKRAIIASTPVFDESGRIIMVVTNLRDMTEIYQIKSELRRKELQTQHYYEKLQSLRRELGGKIDYIATDKAAVDVFRFASHVAEVSDPVLLIGEPGSGKQKLAKYIHQHSGRNLMPFVRINLTSDNPETQMAYLFGTPREREKRQPAGILSTADGGSIYFDEAERILPAVQQKLDEILSSGTYTLDGIIYKVNVRIMVGTQHSLEDLGRYIREDSELYAQLSVFPIQLPPLRSRPDDIVPLADYFLGQYNQKTEKRRSLSPEAYRRLMQYPWPGNITELSNVIKRAAIMADDDVISDDVLCASGGIANESLLQDAAALSRVNLKNEVEKMEASYMSQAFERYRNTRKAADSLGMGPSTFIRKRQQYEKMGLMQRHGKGAEDED